MATLCYPRDDIRVQIIYVVQKNHFNLNRQLNQTMAKMYAIYLFYL